MSVVVDVAATDKSLARLDDVKAELGITDSSSDARLIRLIKEASAAAVSYTGREFIQETVTEKLPSPGGRLIVLERTPIVSISSVKFKNGTALDASEFLIENPDAGIVRRLDKDWTITRVFDHNITLLPTRFGEPDWEFKYVAGYMLDAGFGELQLPEDVQLAVTEITKAQFLRIGRDPTVVTETVDDDTIRYADQGQVRRLPIQAIELLDAYVQVA